MTDSETNPFASPQPESHEVESTAFPTSGVGETFEASDLAVVEDVPAGQSGRVLTQWNKIRAYLSRFWIYLIPTACLGYVAYVHLTRMPLSWPSMTSLQAYFLLFLAAWPLLMISSHYFVPFRFEDRFFMRKLSWEVRRRPATYTPTPSSAGCQFVAIVPPENWRASRLQMMEDIAILRIDPYEKSIFLEGDCKRYRIPSAALTKCSVERILQGWTEIWLLRLNFESTTGPQELYLRVGDGDAMTNPVNSGRKRNAEKYWTRVMLLHQQPSEKKGSSQNGTAS
ncbi:hypothetical protein [Blastopirellula marina]|uniref:Uncharacterized protein n=1 Tax=Blastopirellula marina TaxID=124 RepID=A0A2S8GNT7_9BACT|nr:hypothetical protein [Blastopirellula marina]PQO46113.1 hypothetical protein C5Y93_11090 [Blastopirellula marina]